MTLRDSVAADRVPPKYDANWHLRLDRNDIGEAMPAAARVQRHAPKTSIFDEGEEARALYEVVSGAVMLSKLLPDGRRQIIELLGPGDIFGFAPNGQHDASAETLCGTSVAAFEPRCVAESSALQQRIAARMQAQICALHDHAVLLGRKSALERVATFLMRLVPKRGGFGCCGPTTTKADEEHVRVALTRQEIADYLGLTLETVSRSFSQLKQRGLIRCGRNEDVVIANVCGLCRLAGAN